MKLPFYWIDSFAQNIFTGNPAGVVPLKEWLDDGLMQKIAFENGLAETAFFVRAGEGRFHLRWFAPATEVDLCGHATLAAAYVIFNRLGEKGSQITFDSRSGPLVVRRLDTGELELDFPELPALPEDNSTVFAQVAAALMAEPQWLGRTRFDLFVELADADTVRRLRPDMRQVAALEGRGLIVTAAGDGDGIDFVSRFFCPRVGVPEDPVTGSAHCALAPFWAVRLGRTKLRARQLSPRGGELRCSLDGNRVRIAGYAVPYLEGQIEV